MSTPLTSRPPRFFCTDLPAEPGMLARLTDTEAHHARNVLRLKPGTAVELFDGLGSVVAGEVTELGRNQVDVKLTGRPFGIPLPDRQLVIASAAAKGDRLRWQVEKLTELAADELLLLNCERSVVEPGTNRIDKLMQTVVSACKQSGRNRCLRISAPCGWSEFVASTAATQTMRLLADPAGEPWERFELPDAGRVVIAIGPEGGLTETEKSLALDAGFHAVSLGQHILRIETAAIAAAAILSECWRSETPPASA